MARESLGPRHRQKGILEANDTIKSGAMGDMKALGGSTFNFNLQEKKISPNLAESMSNLYTIDESPPVCNREIDGSHEPPVLDPDESEQQDKDGQYSRSLHIGSTQGSTLALSGNFHESLSELTSEISSTGSSADDLASDTTDDSDESLLEASDANNFDPLLLLIMAHLRHDITNRILKMARGMLHSNQGQRTYTAGGDSSSTRSESDLSGGTYTLSHPNQVGNRGTKRGLDEDGSGNSKGDGHDDNNKCSKPAITAISLRFACPYFKRDSQRHSERRSCRGPGWDTVHRVKYVVRNDVGIGDIERLQLTETENMYTDIMDSQTDVYGVYRSSKTRQV